MNDSRELDDRVRGKTLRWTRTEGPTAGKSHEHVFADDGTVSWRAVGEGAPVGKAAKDTHPTLPLQPARMCAPSPTSRSRASR